MFIPIRSDRPLRSTPHVNYALIALTILIYALTTRQLQDASRYNEIVYEQVIKEIAIQEALGPTEEGETADPYTEQYDYGKRVGEKANAKANQLTREKYPLYNLLLHKHDTSLWQFLTYQFLHASPMHLIGNLLFLWVFGNAVEDRLGKLAYLFFYLSMGVFAGLGHWTTEGASVLGASGSVAGVTGAFLALFPRTRIMFLFFMFIIFPFELPAMVVVLFYFAKDLFFYGLGNGGVAYTAHLAGNAAGFLVAMAMLWPRLLPREPYDLFSMWEHKRRRDKFRKITQQGYQAWEGRGHGMAKDKDFTPEEQAQVDARQAISRAISNHDLTEAARQYRALLDAHGDQVLSQKQQFELANHLAGEGEHQEAAHAYELLLKTYPKHDERAHVQLMLGLIYLRYLERSDDAKPLLQEASQRLHGDDAALARQLLSEIK